MVIDVFTLFPEWFGWFFDQGLMPWDEAKRQLELFATKVMPEFRD